MNSIWPMDAFDQGPSHIPCAIQKYDQRHLAPYSKVQFINPDNCAAAHCALHHEFKKKNIVIFGRGGGVAASRRAM